MLKKVYIFIFITLLSVNAFATQDVSATNNTNIENLFNDNIVTNKNNVNTVQKKQSQNGEPLPENTLYIELKDGIVIAELFPNIAPMHVQRIKILTKDGFYDNVKFHRVIKGFMAQTGDPTGTGKGGSRLGKLYAEFNNEHHVRGTLSMARASDPNSANSQFFIVTGDFFPELDGQYTIFGRVLDGMEYVDKIKTGNTENNGMVENPDEMIKVITGDMLNDKSISQIKEEIKIINKVQQDRLKDDPSYQKKSVLDLLVQTKDVVPNAENISSTTSNNNINNKTNNNVNNNINNNLNNDININSNVNTNITQQNTNNIKLNNLNQNNTNNNINNNTNSNTNTPVEVINNNTTIPTNNNNTNTDINIQQLPSNIDNSINNQTPELPESFEIPPVPDLPELDNVIIEQNTGNKTESTNNDPFADLNNLGLDLPSPYQP